VATSYAYDALGRRVGMTDAAGNEWLWMHDSLGRTYLVDDPDAGVTTYTFDDAGRPLTAEDALGQETSFAYHQTSGRLLSTTVKHAGGTLYRTVSYTYDEARSGYFNQGGITTITSPVDVIRMDYDELGRAVYTERDFEGTTYTLESRYDLTGLTGITYPDGDVVGTPADPIRYNAAGGIVSIPGILTNVSYDALGRPVQKTNFNGTATSFSYDAQKGYLTDLTTTAPGSVTLQDLAYSYDIAGLTTGITSPFPNESWTYTYDDLHRVLASNNVSNPSESTSYQYDIVGNITFNSQVGTLTYPAPGSFRPHAPTQVGAETYTYAANGQLVQQGPDALTWNPDGTLQQKLASFTYGSGGDRLKVIAGAQTSIFPFGDDYEITNGVVTSYVTAPGLGVVAKVVIKSTGTEKFWIHTDRQGSVNVVTDAAGTDVLRRTYRAYGEQQTETGAHVESRGYIDQRTDAASSLTYLHHRYYDARVGVFVSPDPLHPATSGVGANRYSYVFGSPVNGTDRSGLLCVDNGNGTVDCSSGVTVTPGPTNPHPFPNPLNRPRLPINTVHDPVTLKVDAFIERIPTRQDAALARQAANATPTPTPTPAPTVVPGVEGCDHVPQNPDGKSNDQVTLAEMFIGGEVAGFHELVEVNARLAVDWASYHNTELYLAAFWDAFGVLGDAFDGLFDNCPDCAVSESIGTITGYSEMMVSFPGVVGLTARAGVAPSMLGTGGSLLGRNSGALNQGAIRFGWGWRGSRTAGQEIVRVGIGGRGKPIWWHIDIW
jgi:RHS repeat-associated protein